MSSLSISEEKKDLGSLPLYMTHPLSGSLAIKTLDTIDINKAHKIQTIQIYQGTSSPDLHL
jgi:hypothetical protein